MIRSEFGLNRQIGQWAGGLSLRLVKWNSRTPAGLYRVHGCVHTTASGLSTAQNSSLMYLLVGPLRCLPTPLQCPPVPAPLSLTYGRSLLPTPPHTCTHICALPPPTASPSTPGSPQAACSPHLGTSLSGPLTLHHLTTPSGKNGK